MSVFTRIFGRQAPRAVPSSPALSTLAFEMRQRSLDANAGGRRGASFGTFGNTNAEVGANAEIVARRAAYLAVNNP